jgi:hypothetical protein
VTKPAVASKSMPGYERREMVEDLMSDCTDDSPNKIIVTTYILYRRHSTQHTVGKLL